ncbi:hypothetical protein ACFPH6_17535 [Streptomyces xiangluensis]|uniref:Uncharacterized protein n=1 Tax=Streptomyces xiangluensis TaxID=2665720 RepID=A0ABV8YP08_9ACTN
MSTGRGVEGQSADPRLPAKLAGHPSVQAVLARRAAGGVASPPTVIDAAWLRELCLTADADDAAASIEAPLAIHRSETTPSLPRRRGRG